MFVVPRPLAGLAQDARYAVRTLARRPGFAAAVTLTIALAVGVNVAIFAVVRAALLRPLPYAAPERLVHLWKLEARPDTDAGRTRRSEFSWPDLVDVRERTRTLTGVAGYQTARLTLQAGDRALVLPAARVTANFFDVLGVVPVVGRRFERGEDDVGAAPVAIIGHGLWQRAFGGDPAIVGRAVQLDGSSFTVVGVLPPGFDFANSASAEVWAPVDRPTSIRERRGMHWLRPIARLRDGATIETARVDLARIMGDLAREHPATNRDKAGVLEPLRDEMVGAVKPLLLVLYGAVGVVLLVACGNVANLMLMRGAARERELAVRAAIGAGRARLARQLLVESAALALAGGVLGVGVAWVTMRALVAAIPAEQARQLPYLQDLALDGGLLGYALLVALVAGALSGLAPALRAGRLGLQATLRRGTAGATGGATRAVRDGLVVAQLAFAVVLLAGTALFAGSLARLLAVRTGVQAEGVLTMMVPLPRGKYETADQRREFYRALEARVAALPGVTAVGLVTKLPLDAGNTTSFTVVGAPATLEGREPSASFRVANPGYFRAMGIPLLAGATFAGEDTSTARVILVNRTLAREAFGAATTADLARVVGRRIETSGGPSTIIGVVEDVAMGQLGEAVPPTLYLSWRQVTDASMRLAVRTNGDPHALAAPVRRTIAEMDAAVGTWQVYTMEEVIGQSQSVFLRRYPMLLVGTFAGVALLLALVGTYGVVSYAVAQRGRELGIRVALGARPSSILTLVLREAGAVAALGAGLGLVGALALARLAQGLLYGLDGAAQPLLVAGAALLLATLAVTAALLPALRATRVDAVVVLKGE